VSITLLVRTVAVVVAALPSEVRATRAVLISELQATRADLGGQVDAARKDVLAKADGQLGALQSESFRQIAEFRGVADRRLGDTLARVDTALGMVNQLHTDLQPTLANAESITAHASEASAILFRRDALPAQILGLTAAAKITLGQTATTMRSIQEATPQMLATVQQVGDNVKATTEASTAASRNTAQVMANFARATKPLPTWVRIGLAVAPPIAQVGVSVATTLAVTGKVGK
jgi:hypothetical protein